MKVETWIFGITTIFFVIVTPGYWFATSSYSTATATGPAPPRWR